MLDRISSKIQEIVNSSTNALRGEPGYVRVKRKNSRGNWVNAEPVELAPKRGGGFRPIIG